MRLKQLLVAHSLQSVRGILKRFILSEFSDAAITEAASEEEVLTALKRQPFDALLVDGALLFKSAPPLHKMVRGLPAHVRTPLIAVAASDAAEKMKPKLAEGLEHCLAVPFSALELKDMVGAVCNPRSWRVHDRFSIPDAGVILHIGPHDIDAGLININMGGILCDLEYRGQSLDLLQKISISIKLPSPFDRFKIEALRARLSRMNVVSWHSDDRANYLRLTFIFEPLPEATKETLEKFIEAAKIHQQQDLDQLG